MQARNRCIKLAPSLFFKATVSQEGAALGEAGTCRTQQPAWKALSWVGPTRLSSTIIHKHRASSPAGEEKFFGFNGIACCQPDHVFALFLPTRRQSRLVSQQRGVCMSSLGRCNFHAFAPPLPRNPRHHLRLFERGIVRTEDFQVGTILVRAEIRETTGW
jgi:hypothetical protein